MVDWSPTRAFFRRTGMGFHTSDAWSFTRNTAASNSGAP